MYGVIVILCGLVLYNLFYFSWLGDIPAKKWFKWGGLLFAAMVLILLLLPANQVQNPLVVRAFTIYCIIFFMPWTFGFAKCWKDKSAKSKKEKTKKSPTRILLGMFMALLLCGVFMLEYAKNNQSTNPIPQTVLDAYAVFSTVIFILLMVSWNKNETPLLREAFKKPDIRQVKLLDSYTEEVNGGILGGLIGKLLGGKSGMAIGFLMPVGTRYIQRFGVYYSNGIYKIEAAAENSKRYKELMRHVDWGDY